MVRRNVLVASIPFLFVALCRAAPASGDDVYLTNGQTFEDVVAVEAGDKVRILMAGGEMRLPRSQVARIERGASPYLHYLTRREELLADAEATASQWLDLARQALAANLAPSAREAAREAALRDPELPALGALMKRLGYVRDEVLGDWIPVREHRRRMASAAPAETSPEVAERIARQRRQERAEEIWEARKAQLAAAEARLAAEGARLAAERAERSERDAGQERWQQPGWTWSLPAMGGTVFYSTPAPITIVDPGSLPPAPVSQPSGAPVMNLFDRQPGSLIPGQLVLGPPPPPPRR